MEADITYAVTAKLWSMSTIWANSSPSWAKNPKITATWPEFWLGPGIFKGAGQGKSDVWPLPGLAVIRLYLFAIEPSCRKIVLWLTDTLPGQG
jgi:hypothetical protein